MADFVGTVGNSENKIVRRFKDMGDGTWAEVVFTTGGGAAGSTDVTAKQGTGSSANPWFVTNDTTHALTVAGNVSAAVAGNVSAAISGNATVFQGTSPWTVGGNVSAAVAGNVTAAVSGNVTAAQGAPSSANPWFVQNDSSHALFITGGAGSTDVTAKQGTPSSANPWFVQNDSSHALTVAGNVSAAVSGNVTAAVSGNVTASISGNATVVQGAGSSVGPWFVTVDDTFSTVTWTSASAIGSSLGLATTGFMNALFVDAQITAGGGPCNLTFYGKNQNAGYVPLYAITQRTSSPSLTQTFLSSLNGSFIVPALTSRTLVRMESSQQGSMQVAIRRGVMPPPFTGGGAAGSTDVTVKQGTPSSANPWFVQNDSSHALTVAGNVSAAISGNATVVQGAGSSANRWSVRSVTDSTRIPVTLEGSLIQVATVLGPLPLNITTNFTSAAAATDYVISSGRTLNIQSITAGIMQNSSATLGAQGVELQMRVLYQSGATTATTASPVIWRGYLVPDQVASVAGLGLSEHYPFPDGIRIPAPSSNSHLLVAAVVVTSAAGGGTTNTRLTISINGFEYF